MKCVHHCFKDVTTSFKEKKPIKTLLECKFITVRSYILLLKTYIRTFSPVIMMDLMK